MRSNVCCPLGRFSAPAIEKRGLGAAALGLLLACTSNTSLAQGAVGARNLTVTPTFETGISFNRRSSTLDGSNGQDVAVQVRPGLQVNSRSGRLQGSLSYSLAAVRHTERTEDNGLQHSLSSAFLASIVDGWFYVDAQASIGQQSRSAFGEQSADTSFSSSANRAEVGNVSITPYVTGRLGSLADYRASVSGSATNTRGSSTNDSSTKGAAVGLSSQTSSSLLGWSLDSNWQEVDFRVGRTTSTGRAQATLNIVPDVDWALSLRAGVESTNVSTLESRNYNNWGSTIRWTPSPRTVATLEVDRRYFGDSHRLSFQHRMARSSIRLSSVRDVTSGASTASASVPFTLYQLMLSVFASASSDPAEQERLANQYFRDNPGLDPSTLIGGGSLASGVSLVRRDDIAFSYTGLRTNLTLLAFSGDSKVIDNPTGAPDSAPVRQWGYTVSAGYRLTPTDSINLTGSQQRTLASGSQAGNDLKAVSLGWTGQMGRRTTVSFGARYALFNSVSNPYRESAVSGSLSLRF